MSAKRIFDFVASFVGLVLLLPLWGLIALAIKLDSPGAIIFRGTRVGKHGNLFSILKFRTMVADAPQRGAAITTRGDARITRMGRFLRYFKLDELPQLFNVLRGEMSLVGPRPEDPRFLRYYTPVQRTVLQCVPGITSVASVAFRNEAEHLAGAAWEDVYIHTLLPQKLDLELEYMRRANFWSDLGIIARSVFAVGKAGMQSYVVRPRH